MPSHTPTNLLPNAPYNRTGTSRTIITNPLDSGIPCNR
jgi:hypothetical protein